LRQVSSIFVSIPVSKFMMRHLYLVSALLLCHPVSSERDADCSAKLTPEAEMKCKRAKRKASSFTDHVSLATQNQVSLTTQINTDILLRVTEMEDKDKVAEFQGVALRTVLDAIRFFTAKKSHSAEHHNRSFISCPRSLEVHHVFHPAKDPKYSHFSMVRQGLGFNI